MYVLIFKAIWISSIVYIHHMDTLMYNTCIWSICWMQGISRKHAYITTLMLIVDLCLTANSYITLGIYFTLKVNTSMDKCGILCFFIYIYILMKHLPLLFSGHTSTVWASSFSECGNRMVTCRYLTLMSFFFFCYSLLS